jgi:hypothetical protein
MRLHVAKLMPTLFVGGCSLIYNPSNIDKGHIDASDGPRPDVEMTADADIDAPPIADANPGMLTLLDVGPRALLEGQGQFGSRQAMLVISGHHIISDGLSVSITPSTGLTIGAPIVSANGDFIAVPVAVAISATDSGSTPLTINVQETGGPVGGVSLTGKLSLTNLPQFPTTTSVATGSLAPLYSDVNTGNVTFTGTQRAVVRSVSRIKIGNIVATGGAGTTNGAGVAGPGGCAGGDMAANAPCLQADGGGGGAGGNSGGGGGGYAIAGGTGVAGTAAGGAAGSAHGQPQIINYGMANQGAGGGGGGKGALSNSGGGGGGGGTVELTAGGTLEVGTINVKGGAGGDGSSLVSLGASGGGGGGSGGVVVLRSDASITGGAITATGGTGGMAGGGGAGGGGAGAPGRVRVDTPAGTLPASDPELHRGPAFTMPPSTIVTDKNITLELSGTSGDVVDAYVLDAAGAVHTGEPMGMMFTSGTLSFQGVLIPGYNKFCVTLEPGTRGQSDQLADKCIELAYLP